MPSIGQKHRDLNGGEPSQAEGFFGVTKSDNFGQDCSGGLIISLLLLCAWEWDMKLLQIISVKN